MTVRLLIEFYCRDCHWAIKLPVGGWYRTWLWCGDCKAETVWYRKD